MAKDLGGVYPEVHDVAVTPQCGGIRVRVWTPGRTLSGKQISTGCPLSLRYGFGGGAGGSNPYTRLIGYKAVDSGDTILQLHITKSHRSTARRGL